MQYQVGEYTEKIFKRCTLIAGIDEVGRGPLAGPVVACAVVFRKGFSLEGLNDSKKLSPKRRAELCKKILDGAECVNWSFIDERKIDEINIFQAAKQAMLDSVAGLVVKPEYLLIDAMQLPSISIEQESLVKGDQREPCIMAASIVAKEVRDGYMRQLGDLYPEYGFERHMGYGTAQHMKALSELGVQDCHRRSFKPVMQVLLTREGALELELRDKSKVELVSFINMVKHMGLDGLLSPKMSLFNSYLRQAS